MQKISIVIPVYNSSENLRELVYQLDKALVFCKYEIIFVNDYSKDNSWEIICDLCANNNKIIGINFRKNFGQDNALLAGLQNTSGEYIVIMDDDLQHSPFDIEKLYLKCLEGYDICFADFRNKEQAAWKNAGSWLNGKIATILLGKPKDLYLSPFKIIKGSVVRDIKFRGAFPYIDGILLELTQNIISIEIKHFKRFKGKSNYNLIKSISVFLKTLTSFSVIPLRIAALTGFIIAVFGFTLGGYYLYEYFTNTTVEGWTTLIVTLLIIGGLMLMFIGLIGEYLGRMYLTVNNKPQYSIGEILNKENENI